MFMGMCKCVFRLKVELMFVDIMVYILNILWEIFSFDYEGLIY